MYWLLPFQVQEAIRDRITLLLDEIVTEKPYTRQPYIYYLTFSGRKAENIAHIVIKHLSANGDLIGDPFLGSGTFLFAGLHAQSRVLVGDIDPYISRMVGNLVRGRTPERFTTLLASLKADVQDFMDSLYRTKCGKCGHVLAMKAVYFDFEPREYINPTPHERIHEGGKNVVYTYPGKHFRGKAKCPGCGEHRKKFDQEDLNHLEKLELQSVATFPDHELLINPRINITSGRSDHYGFFFTHRAKLALLRLWEAISALPECHEKHLLQDAYLATLHIAKITDYRTKSQDLYHIPSVQCKENNVWWQYLSRLDSLASAQTYIAENVGVNVAELTELETSIGNLIASRSFPRWAMNVGDFRDSLHAFPRKSCSLIITDPPYTDQVPHMERHQLFYPWLGIDFEDLPLSDEVVITDAPARDDKHDREQYFADIEDMFEAAAGALKTHGFLVIYFHPAKRHWAEDLNWFKLLGRKHGLEPIQNIDISRSDPTVRKQASAAWEFNDDIILIYLKVADSERYWFEGDVLVDKLIYAAAAEAAQGHPFTIQEFNDHLYPRLRQHQLLRLVGRQFEDRRRRILERYAEYKDGVYVLRRGIPFEHMLGRATLAQRIRDFTPLIVEELFNEGPSFTFPDFVLRLSQYLDNGEKELIEELQADEHLIETTLESYVMEADNGVLVRRPELDISIFADERHRTNLFEIEPFRFELLIKSLLEREGYTQVQVVGRSGDRGIDIVALSPKADQLFIQVKRWQANVSAAPIQRIHSAAVSRGAKGSWVITTSSFTAQAEDEATRYTGTQLTDGHELMRLLEAHFPGRFRLGEL